MNVNVKPSATVRIINKFLLTGAKFILEMHLSQPRFTYLACGTFTKHRERIKKI